MNFRKHFPKYRLALPLTLLLAVLLAGFITLLALWCQPNSLRSIAATFLKKPILIVLNALPIGLLLLTVTCLFRNLFFGAAAVSLAVGLLSVANRIKIEVRDEPVFPRDFALLKEVGSAISSYDIHFPAAVLTAVIAVSAVFLLLGFLIGLKPFPVKKLRGWAGSLAGAAGCFALLLVFIFTAARSNDLYNRIGATNLYRLSAVFNENGFPYNFCHQFTTYVLNRPEGFDRAQAEKWDTEEPDRPGQENLPVNVVIVMNEAFSDVTDHPALSFDEGQDPLKHLHALRDDPRAVLGHLVVPGFAAGTANTEFDVLTGMQTNSLSLTTTSAFRTVNRNLDSLFRVFGEDGYHTSFFHPGENWFYNRENVYHWMGAEKTLFNNHMPDMKYKGSWVSDAYCGDLIEAEFEETMAKGESLFHYTTTIQNHMAYTPEKYGADFPYPPVYSSVPLSGAAETQLRVYAEGARDADILLGRLVDYFRQREEPVVLVYYGDHVPYLGDNKLTYTELGMDQEPLWEEQHAYETPLVLWCNDAADGVLGWDRAIAALDLPEDGSISASFLGAAVLELTGRGDDNVWFAFLNRLRRLAPVVQNQFYVLSDGTGTRTPDEDLAREIARWRSWTYYKLRYKEIGRD